MADPGADPPAGLPAVRPARRGDHRRRRRCRSASSSSRSGPGRPCHAPGAGWSPPRPSWRARRRRGRRWARPPTTSRTTASARSSTPRPKPSRPRGAPRRPPDAADTSTVPERGPGAARRRLGDGPGLRGLPGGVRGQGHRHGVRRAGPAPGPLQPQGDWARQIDDWVTRFDPDVVVMEACCDYTQADRPGVRGPRGQRGAARHRRGVPQLGPRGPGPHPPGPGRRRPRHLGAVARPCRPTASTGRSRSTSSASTRCTGTCRCPRWTGARSSPPTASTPRP